MRNLTFRFFVPFFEQFSYDFQEIRFDEKRSLREIVHGIYFTGRQTQVLIMKNVRSFKKRFCPVWDLAPT